MNGNQDALLISLLSLNLQKKEVIVPSFSFFATSEAIVQAGLIPIFVDIDRTNCNIDVTKIAIQKAKKILIKSCLKQLIILPSHS